MSQLTRASKELFRRQPDERFESLSDLHRHCQDQQKRSSRIREVSSWFRPVLDRGELLLQVGGYEPFRMNDWSFGQVCSLAGAAKETVTRLSPDTAVRALSETLGQRTSEEFDLQACVVDDAIVRSIHSDRYRRVWNGDGLDVVRDVAGDFVPPEKGFNGATGLYAGEQDMFAFLVDPTGWVDVYGEQFAPGFFVWNSEVGRRSVGVSTFWYQRICANHIVWDAIEVVEVQKTHTARASTTLETIRTALAALIEKRNARRDGFARSIQLAMDTPYGDDAEEAETQLVKAGFTRAVAKKATELGRREGRITLWGVIDGLTKLNREHAFAGARLEADTKAASLLSLAA